MLRAPGQLGLGRAYVSGALEVDDIDEVLRLLDGYSPPPIDTKAKLRLARAAVEAGALKQVPRTPAAELRPEGRRHSIARDKRAVTYHYDVSNEFFALFLDESMTYSCAVWSRGATTLEEAQYTKRDLVCTKLALQEGERILDVGCGWGSFAVHAAEHYGVHVTGITLSEPQAQGARERAEAAGRGRPLRVPRHGLPRAARRAVRRDRLDRHGRARRRGQHRRLLRDARAAAQARRAAAQPRHRAAAPRRGGGGRVLRALRVPRRGPAAPLPRPVLAGEERASRPATSRGSGWTTRRRCASGCAGSSPTTTRRSGSPGPERMRVWEVYLRAARRGFETGFTSVYQVLADRA